MRVSEIRVNQIRVNQGLGVLIYVKSQSYQNKNLLYIRVGYYEQKCKFS